MVRKKKILYSEGGFPEIDANGNVKTRTYSYVQLEDSDDVDGSIITEVKQGRDGISVKLADKMKALEMLAKYTDLLSENNKKKLQEEKLKMDIVKLERESNPDTSTEDKLKDYFTALGGAFRDN